MKKFLPIPIVFAVLLFSGSCRKGFLTSLAVNPNAPSTATPQLLLPGVQFTISANANGTLYENQGVWAGYWNYSGGYTYNTGTQTFQVTSSGPQCWNNWYSPLASLEIMEQESGGKGMEDFAGIGVVLKSLCFQYLVDAYNDVPYTSALLGANDLFPSYNAGQDIYTSLINQMDSGIALIQQGISDQTAINPGASDIMFKGNMNLWLHFANSVKLRMLVRESQVSSQQSFIQTEATKTAAAGFMGLGEDALANPGFSNSADSKQNPLWGVLGSSVSGTLHTDGFNYRRAGGYAMEFYKNTNDPRLGYFYGTINQALTDPAFFSPTVPEDTNNYNADPLGEQQSHTSSPIGPGVIPGPGAPAVVMLASEALFVQAEAVARGYLPGNAETLYQQAITASFEYLGVSNNSSGPDALAAAYYSQNIANVAWPGSLDSQINVITTQKWAALNGISMAEAWNDWRRTGNSQLMAPNFAPSTGHPLVGPHAPYRYYYPDIESQTNSAAEAKATNGAAIDPYNNKIFWMP